MAATEKWSIHLKLVEAVHHHGQKFLYDMKSRGWRNKHLILNEYKRLLDMDEALKSIYSSPEHACECFKRCRKEYNRRTRLKTLPSGSGADEPIDWPLYNSLTFLDPYIKDRDTDGNYGKGGECTIKRRNNNGNKQNAAEEGATTMEEDEISAATPMQPEQSSDHENREWDSLTSRNEDALANGREEHNGGGVGGSAGVPGQNQSINLRLETSSGAGSTTVNSLEEEQHSHGEASMGKKIDKGAPPKPSKRSRKQRGTSADEMAADDGDRNAEKEKILEVLRQDPSINLVWAEHLGKQMDAAFSTIDSAEFRAEVDARMVNKLKEIEQRRLMNMTQGNVGMIQHHVQQGFPNQYEVQEFERPTGGQESFESGQQVSYAYLNNMEM